MTSNSAAHPSHDDLVLYGHGRLQQDRATLVEEHVSSCDQCCDLLRSLTEDTLTNRLRQSDADTNYFPPINDEAVPQLTDALPAELENHPRYRVMKRVGSGGMGVVFKAEHRFMERLVALKVMNNRLIRNQIALDRFHQEVKAAARLSHPNIVTAYDAEQVGTLQVLVMEYVDGISIARQVEKAGPIPIRFACQFARQAAIGLQHALEKGMIHRDIKPQNLMLTRDAQVKILDFGLARYAGETNPADSTPTPSGSDIHADQRLTQYGKALGTPDYMAPEQIRSAADVDIRADIYSLGCTLYYMLAGHPPFPGGTLAEKMISQLEYEPTELRTLRPEVPVALQNIFKRMTAKNPADRFSTPAEVVEALTPFIKPNAPVAPPAPPAPLAVPSPLEDRSRSMPLPEQKDPKEKPAPQRSRNARSRARLQSPKLRHKSKRYLLPLLVITGLIAMASVVWIMTNQAVKQPVTADGNKSPSILPNVTHKPPGVLIVVPHEDYWLPDVENVRSALKSIGATTTIASSQRSPARASRKGPFREPLKVDLLLSDAQATDYVSIVFTGANPSESLEHLRDSKYEEITRKLIGQFMEQNKPIASICMGSRVLADLGFLKGRDAARCPYQPMDEQYSNKASWKDDQVVIDGPFISGKDQDAANPLVQKILEHTRGK